MIPLLPKDMPVSSATGDSSGPLLVLSQTPRKLLPVAPYRVVMILSNLAAFPLAFAAMTGALGDGSSVVLFFLAIAAPAVSLLCAVAWSGFATVNAGRVRPHGRYTKRPSVPNATLSWFAPVVVPGVLAVVSATWSDELRSVRTSLGAGDGEMLVVAIGMALVVVLLVCAYRPYSVLRKLSRWVGGDQKRFRNWFFAPIFGALTGIVLLVANSLISNGAILTGFDDAQISVAIFAPTLPWIFWLVAGNRAMADLESSTRSMQDKLRRDSLWVSADESAD